MSLSNIVGKVAPVLGSLLTAAGPVGAAAAAAIDAVLGEKASLNFSESLKNATPEQVVRLREVEYEFRARMRQLDVEEQKAFLLDTADARKSNAETKDSTPRILSYVIVSAVLLYIGAVTFMPISDSGLSLAKDIMLYLVGVLTSVLAYWFGSSIGSKAKSDQISVLTNKR